MSTNSEPDTGAFAIIPNNDLGNAIGFWEQLGFEHAGGAGQYVIMKGWGCEVHLTQAGEEPWRIRPEANPFGVFIRTPYVDQIAERADAFIIRPGGLLRHREWGLYEVGINAPDGLLLRVGWPSALIEQA
ncbi:MAG: glyoxalase [Pseudomonadota bacterium]